ncbi:MAG: hypothetical protein K0Q73_7289 [Paenibacillus sp.]|nr:hypothetical protein [Paenibacillus sp.]
MLLLRPDEEDTTTPKKLNMSTKSNVYLSDTYVYYKGIQLHLYDGCRFVKVLSVSGIDRLGELSCEEDGEEGSY